jgi:hypothetical protein
LFRNQDEIPFQRLSPLDDRKGHRDLFENVNKFNFLKLAEVAPTVL